MTTDLGGTSVQVLSGGSLALLSQESAQAHLSFLLPDDAAAGVYRLQFTLSDSGALVREWSIPFAIERVVPEHSWQPLVAVNDGILDLDSGAVRSVRAMVAHDDVMLVAVDGTSNIEGIYRSTDRGLNFTKVDFDNTIGADDAFHRDPANPNRIYFAGDRDLVRLVGVFFALMIWVRADKSAHRWPFICKYRRYVVFV